MARTTNEIAPGTYEVTANGAFPVKALRGVVNRGTTDCTAHVYRHEGGGSAGPRGRQVCEFTLLVGKQSMAPQGWLPPEEPLIVEVVDFSDAPPEVAEFTPRPPSLAVTAHAALFPGFVVLCETCRSGNISLTTLPGKSYLECEDCGAMCRLRLEA